MMRGLSFFVVYVGAALALGGYFTVFEPGSFLADLLGDWAAEAIGAAFLVAVVLAILGLVGRSSNEPHS